MKTIRAALALIALCALTTIDVRPSAAEIYRPWCAQYVGGDGNNGTTCAFSSYEQCMLTARGAGAYCVQNPWYMQYGPGGERPDTTGRGERTRR
jgi:hypothetical protein